MTDPELTRAEQTLTPPLQQWKNLWLIGGQLVTGLGPFLLLWMLGWQLAQLYQVGPAKESYGMIRLEQLILWGGDTRIKDDHGIGSFALAWTAINSIMAMALVYVGKGTIKRSHHYDEQNCAVCGPRENDDAIQIKNPMILDLATLLSTITFWVSIAGCLLTLQIRQEAISLGLLLLAGLTLIILSQLNTVKTTSGVPPRTHTYWRELHKSAPLTKSQETVQEEYKQIAVKTRFFLAIPTVLLIVYYTICRQSPSDATIDNTILLPILMCITFPILFAHARLAPLLAIATLIVGFLLSLSMLPVPFQTDSTALITVIIGSALLLASMIAPFILIWPPKRMAPLRRAKALLKLQTKMPWDLLLRPRRLQMSEIKMYVSDQITPPIPDTPGTLTISYLFPFTENFQEITYKKTECKSQKKTKKPMLPYWCWKESQVVIHVPTGSILRIELNDKNTRWKDTCWVATANNRIKKVPVIADCTIPLNYLASEQGELSQAVSI